MRHERYSHEALRRHAGRYEVLSNLSKDKMYRGEKLVGSVAVLPLRKKLFEMNQLDVMQTIDHIKRFEITEPAIPTPE